MKDSSKQTNQRDNALQSARKRKGRDGVLSTEVILETESINSMQEV